MSHSECPQWGPVWSPCPIPPGHPRGFGHSPNTQGPGGSGSAASRGWGHICHHGTHLFPKWRPTGFPKILEPSPASPLPQFLPSLGSPAMSRGGGWIIPGVPCPLSPLGNVTTLLLGIIPPIPGLKPRRGTGHAAGSTTPNCPQSVPKPRCPHTSLQPSPQAVLALPWKDSAGIWLLGKLGGNFLSQWQRSCFHY